MLAAALSQAGCSCFTPVDDGAVDGSAGPDVGLDASVDASEPYRCVVPDRRLSPEVEALAADLFAGRAECQVKTWNFGCLAAPTVEDVRKMEWNLDWVVFSKCADNDLAKDLRLLDRAVRLGKARVDVARQAACKAMSGDAPYGDAGVFLPECKNLVAGLVPLGGECTDHFECEDGACVLSTEGSCKGTCVRQPREGESCADLRCGDGLLCEVADAGSPTCRKAPGLGDPCARYCSPVVVTVDDASTNLGEECLDFCPARSKCELGVCTALPVVSLGEACNADHATCEDGLVCDSRRGRCLKRLGSACATTSDCANCGWCDEASLTCVTGGRDCQPGVDGGAETDVPPYYWCAPSGLYELKPRTGQACLEAVGCLYADDWCRVAGDGAGTCTPRPGPCESCEEARRCAEGECLEVPGAGRVCVPGLAGDPCSSSCEPGLRCRAGTCRAPAQAAGEACSETDDCGEGLFCEATDGGARGCQPRRTAGAPCLSGAECLSDSCEESSCGSSACPDLRLAGRGPGMAADADNCVNMGGLDYLGYLVFFAAALSARRRFR